jgi:hypothetical protein
MNIYFNYLNFLLKKYIVNKKYMFYKKRETHE